MRSIRGFERPSFQYMFVALSVALIGVGIWGGVSVRRAAREIERLHAAALNDRIEREKLEARAAREQSARESLTLEIARSRSAATAAAKPSDMPTLTLTPLTRRESTPPPVTVAPPLASQVIALRLVLPRGAGRDTTYQIAIRSWSGGQTVWSRGDAKSIEADGRRLVQAYVTGDVFAAGAYEVLLTGTGADGMQKEVASYEVPVG
jgi:hypothetical protein